MLTFSPPELEGAFRRALGQMDDAITVLYDGSGFAPDFETDDYDELNFMPETSFELSFSRSDTDATLSMSELIHLAEDIKSPHTTFDGLMYHSHHRTVLRVTSWDMRSISFADRVGDESPIGAAVTTDLTGHGVSVGLRSTSAHFASAVVFRNFFYDKYNPPMTNDDLFVEVVHPMGADPDAASAVIQAYLFELHATLGLEYFEWPRPVGDTEYPEDEEISDLVSRSTNLRPLLSGQGLASLLQEFNLGYGPIQGEAALLCYVKCIEYVAATVVREKQYEDLRKRLLSRDALNPDAQYMDGLLTLFEENRVFTRDAEALRLAVERCCDPLPMASHAPEILKGLGKLSAVSTVEQRKGALADLAIVLTATRNQIAHAKANYKPTGRECPSAQLGSLVSCAKTAAEQCIRWYASRPPELRRA